MSLIKVQTPIEKQSKYSKYQWEKRMLSIFIYNNMLHTLMLGTRILLYTFSKNKKKVLEKG